MALKDRHRIKFRLLMQNLEHFHYDLFHFIVKSSNNTNCDLQLLSIIIISKKICKIWLKIKQRCLK